MGGVMVRAPGLRAAASGTRVAQRGWGAPVSLRSAEFAATAGMAGAVAVMGVLGGAFYPLPRIAVGAAMAVLLGLAWLVRTPRLDRLEAVLLVCVGWGVVAAAISHAAPLAAKETLTGWLVAWMLFAWARRSPQNERSAGQALLIGGAVVIAAGVAAEAAGLGSVRAGGLFENPNSAAAILAPMVPATLGARPTTVRRLLACALVIAVILTASRAALLALVVAAVVALSKRWQRWGAGVAGLLGLGGLVWWRLALHADSLAWFRLRIWSAVTRLLVSSPIVGVGPGGLADAAGSVRVPTESWCAIHAYRIAYAESSPLGWAVQTGAVGLLLAVAGAWLWWRAAGAHGTFRVASQRATFAAMAVIFLFHDLLQVEVVLWWWALLLAATVSVGKGARPRATFWWRSERLLAAAVVSCVVLWGIVQPALARTARADGADPHATDRALAIEPWLDEAALARTEYLLRQPRWDWDAAGEAQDRAQAALAVHSGSAACWAAVARVNARIVADLGTWPGAVVRARAAFARACALEPNLPWYWLDWARFERALGRAGRARELISRATDAEPNCVSAWLLLARIELDGGRIDAARAAVARANTARRCGRGRLLSAYERLLLDAPAWQWRSLKAALG